VNTEDGENYAKQNGLGFIETSALSGENIGLAFQLLVKCKIFYLLLIFLKKYMTFNVKKH
jgi:hypothetical protein